ncbi:hypothetical protein GW575_08700 [Campylobacter sp. MIT 19-121]|uniref:hypothetical protein n=1 Tax=Campylobacter sp. MIT 19-121 TaxID=2703906 RepID=UPI001389F39E|nr:hypothetical protein [Campylobacter sp. MIT 19-121]NDJ28017.1 hypothetical protein [Campylobacter sp. MIT 19-121]
MKSLKLLTSTLILGAVLTACSSDSVSGNFKPKNEYQEKALELATKDINGRNRNAFGYQILSYEEIKTKYNIPATAKICGMSSSGYSVAFTDNVEDYKAYLKSGKYVIIPVFYTETEKKTDKKRDLFESLDYRFETMTDTQGVRNIDPKTCE